MPQQTPPARSPLLRRAAGTELVITTPVITANSNCPRTAVIRQFCVAGAAPRRSDERTNIEPAARLGRACQSR